MTQRIIRDEIDRKLLYRFLATRPLPFTIDVTLGAHRSTAQNKLQRLWMNEAAAQLEGHTPEELRGLCKLTHGVPILRAENEAFREKYDAVVKPLPYQAKLAIMMEPLDLPVTRLMTTRQKTFFLDRVFEYFTGMGVKLTAPEDRERQYDPAA